jgi:hypothetical protein
MSASPSTRIWSRRFRIGAQAHDGGRHPRLALERCGEGRQLSRLRYQVTRQARYARRFR